MRKLSVLSLLLLSACTRGGGFLFDETGPVPGDGGWGKPRDAVDGGRDGGMVAQDGGVPGADAGLPDDGGVPGGDASVPDHDAAMPEADAGQDGGNPVLDAGPPPCVSPPAMPQLRLQPENPTTADDVSVEMDAVPGCTFRYEVRWYRDEEEVLSLRDLNVVPYGLTSKNQEWRVSVTAYDSDDAPSPAASLGWRIGNAAPTASLFLPAAVTVDEDLRAMLMLGDPDNDPRFDPDPNNDDVLGVEIRWMRDGEAVADLDDQSVVPSARLRPGATWRITVTPNDGNAIGTPVSASLAVTNRAPSITSVQLGPPTARRDSTLSAFAEGLDPDDDPNATNGPSVGFTWTWRINGVQVADQSGATLSALLPEGGYRFRKGDVVVAYATAISDGQVAGPEASNELLIENSPPHAERVWLEPRDCGASACPQDPSTWLYSGTAIRCSADLQDIDDDVLTPRYRWVRDPAGSAEVLEHETAMLPAGVVLRGDVISCSVTPDDGTVEGSTGTATATVRNAPPRIGPALIRATDDAGATVAVPTGLDVLHCAPSALSAESPSVTLADADDPLSSLTVATRWYRKTSAGGRVEIATGSTLPAGSLTRGDEVECSLTPQDPIDPGETQYSAPLVVSNTPPTLSTGSVSLLPENPTALSSLTCDVATGAVVDYDGDGVTLLYQWYAAWPGESPQLLSEGEGEAGRLLPARSVSGSQEVYCSVRASDGADESNMDSSPAVLVANTAPTLSGAIITPNAPRADSDFQCEPQGLLDVDTGDDLVATIVWEVTDPQGGVTQYNDALPAAQRTKGNQIRCQLTFSDGQASSLSRWSPAIQIVDTPGELRDFVITPETPNSGQPVTCSATYYDPDPGDTGAVLALRWLDQSEAEYDPGYVSTASAPPAVTLAAAAIARGDQIVCEVTATPNDPSAQPITQRSAWLTVANGSPTLSEVAIQESAPNAHTPLTAFASGSDPDGDELRYEWEWCKKTQGTGSCQVIGTGDTLDPTLLSSENRYRKDDIVQLKAWARERDDSGTSWGPPVPQNTPPAEVVIGNAPPPMVAAEIVPKIPLRHSTDVFCTLPSDAPTTDIDGETIQYYVEWSMDNGASFITGTDDRFLSTDVNIQNRDTIDRNMIPITPLTQCRIISRDAEGVAEMNAGKTCAESLGCATGDTDVLEGVADGPWVFRVDGNSNPGLDFTPDPTLLCPRLECTDGNGGCSLRAALELAQLVKQECDKEGMVIELEGGITYQLDGDIPTIETPIKIKAPETRATIRPMGGAFRTSTVSMLTENLPMKVVFENIDFQCQNTPSTTTCPTTIGTTKTRPCSTLSMLGNTDATLTNVDFHTCESAIHILGGAVEANNTNIYSPLGASDLPLLTTNQSTILIENAEKGWLGNGEPSSDSYPTATFANTSIENHHSGGESAITIRSPITATFINLVANNNRTAGNGGHINFTAESCHLQAGATCPFPASQKSTLVIEDSNLSKGAATHLNALGNGGAISITQNGILIIKNSTLRENSAVRGGAIWAGGTTTSKTVKIQNSTLQLNKALSAKRTSGCPAPLYICQGYGGAIFMSGAGDILPGMLEVEGSVIGAGENTPCSDAHTNRTVSVERPEQHQGGGVYLLNSTISNPNPATQPSYIRCNQSAGAGGGLNVNNVSGLTVDIAGITITDNISDSSVNGQNIMCGTSTCPTGRVIDSGSSP